MFSIPLFTPPTPLPRGFWEVQDDIKEYHAFKIELLGVKLGWDLENWGFVWLLDEGGGLTRYFLNNWILMVSLERGGGSGWELNERELSCFSSTVTRSSDATVFSPLPAIYVLPVIIAPFSVFIHVVPTYGFRATI